MEHLVKTYTCDRCDADMGDTLPNRKTDICISYTLQWTQAARNVIWRHLCDKCFKLIEQVIPITDQDKS